MERQVGKQAGRDQKHLAMGDMLSIICNCVGDREVTIKKDRVIIYQDDSDLMGIDFENLRRAAEAICEG
tara:strand:- start:326 stop:532 length:207 start_codon:yes stop_codon:yes gene_type:complete